MVFCFGGTWRRLLWPCGSKGSQNIIRTAQIDAAESLSSEEGITEEKKLSRREKKRLEEDSRKSKPKKSKKSSKKSKSRDIECEEQPKKKRSKKSSSSSSKKRSHKESNSEEASGPSRNRPISKVKRAEILEKYKSRMQSRKSKDRAYPEESASEREHSEDCGTMKRAILSSNRWPREMRSFRSGDESESEISFIVDLYDKTSFNNSLREKMLEHLKQDKIEMDKK